MFCQVSSNIKYSDLTFFVVFQNTELFLKRCKTLVGSIHQLSELIDKPPKIFIFVNSSKFSISDSEKEEIQSWDRVSVKIKQFYKKENFKFTHLKSNLIEIIPDYYFNHIKHKWRRAEKGPSELGFENAQYFGRNQIMALVKNCVNLYDKEKAVLITCSNTNNSRQNINDFGMQKMHRFSKKDCYINLKSTAILTGAQFATIEDKNKLLSMQKTAKLDVVLGVPSTNRMGLSVESHSLVKIFFPSLISSIILNEFELYRIAVFIGFDSDDLFFANSTWRSLLESKIIEITGSKVLPIFLKLHSFKRVAITWNMIFALAKKNFPFDYFYQVNDDLNFITKGWLSKFVLSLKKLNNVGVVGPSDVLHNFNCSLLTQSFVSKKHFKIFDGHFFPIQFKDWKSDRWMTFVYGEKNTLCFQEYQVRNGGPARYVPCEYPNWISILEKSAHMFKQYSLKSENRISK